MLIESAEGSRLSSLAESGSKRSKHHVWCVAALDDVVRTRKNWGTVAEWEEEVLCGWFSSDEEVWAVISRAEAHLRKLFSSAKQLDVKLLGDPIRSGSFAAFFVMDILTEVLLFGCLEIEQPQRSQDTSLSLASGFTFFVSSSGRAWHETTQTGRQWVSKTAIRILNVIASLDLLVRELEMHALVRVLAKRVGILQDKGTTSLKPLKGRQQFKDVPQEPVGIVGIVDTSVEVFSTVRHEQTAASNPLGSAMSKLDVVLTKQGPVDLKGLERSLELLSRKAGAVDCTDFDKALQCCHVNLEDEETSTIFQALNRGDLVVGCAELVQFGCPPLSERMEASLRGVLEKGSSEKKAEESGSNLLFLLQFSGLFLRNDSSEPGAAGPTKEQVRNQLDSSDQGLLESYLQHSVSQTQKCVDSATGELLSIEGQFTKLKAIEKRSMWTECEASEEANEKDLICPITLSIIMMDDPVWLSGGDETETWSYLRSRPCERAAITKLMEEKKKSMEKKKKTLSQQEFDNWERKFDTWELKPAGDKKEEITAYIKGMQEKLLGQEQQMEGEEERQLMMHRKGYAASRAIDQRSASKMVSDEDILSDCYSGQKMFCVIGPPASGKTTTMLRIATRAAKRALENESALIPLFLRATELASLLSESEQEADQVVDFVEFYILHAQQLQTAHRILHFLYRHGKLLVIVDGLDEAGVFQSAIERFLNSLAAQYSVGAFQGNHLLVSTRTASYTESRVWLRLTKFVPVEIQPLDEAAARQIIHHRISNDDQEEELWRQLQSVAKNKLQLLANPFLLCLVVSIFKQSGSIPSERGELYRLFVEGMVQRCLSTSASAESLHTEEQVKVDSEQAVQFLQCLAYVCHLGESPTRDFALDNTFMVLVQDRWTNHLRLPGELVSVLKTVLIDESLCGVLTVAGGKKRFSHLTQQEFLAACHVVHCAARSSDPARQVLDTFSRFSILDPWIREVLLHCACRLQDGSFVHFCSLLLEHEDGTIVLCELVKELLRERGQSSAVQQMLERKYAAFRSVDEIGFAFCHPSNDLRERALTELKTFAPEMTPDVIKGLIHLVRYQSVNTWFEKCAAILSVSLLCDNFQSATTVSNALKFVLFCLSNNALWHVSTRALGTIVRAADSQSDPGPGNTIHGAIKELFVESTDVDLLAGALAEMTLVPRQLVCIFAESQYQSPVLTENVLSYIEAIARADSNPVDTDRAFLQLVRNLLAGGWYGERERSLRAAAKLLEKCKTSHDVPEVSLLLNGTSKLLSLDFHADFESDFRDLSMLAIQFRLHELDNPLEVNDVLKIPETTRPDVDGREVWTCGSCGRGGNCGRLGEGWECELGVHSEYCWPGWGALYQANPHLMRHHECCLCAVKHLDIALTEGRKTQTDERGKKRRQKVEETRGNKKDITVVCAECAKTRRDQEAYPSQPVAASASAPSTLVSTDSAAESCRKSICSWLQHESFSGAGGSSPIGKDWWRTRLQDLLLLPPSQPEAPRLLALRQPQDPAVQRFSSSAAAAAAASSSSSSCIAEGGLPDLHPSGLSSISREELQRWDEDIIKADVTRASFPSHQLYQLAFESKRPEDLEHDEKTEMGDLAISTLRAFLDLKFADSSSKRGGRAEAKVLDLNSEEGAALLVKTLKLGGLGRFLFTPVLRHVEKTVRENPEMSVKQLCLLKKALQAADLNVEASDLALTGNRHMRLEVQMILKEMEVGPRNEAPVLWHGPSRIKWGGMEPSWKQICAMMDILIDQACRGDRTLHEIIAMMVPPPPEAVARVLMGIADDIEPPAEASTRGRGKGIMGATTDPPFYRILENLWKQLQIDTCTFSNGEIICARVFRTDEEGVYHKPDEVGKQVRVYHVERGVEMCLGVKNFMTKEIPVEPFYVDTEEKETSEGGQVIYPCGKTQLKFKSELSEGETQDGWRLKDKSGEVILTVYLRCVES